MKYYLAALLVLMSLLTIDSPVSAQEVKIDLLGIVNTIFNPPHRQAEIDAQAEIAKAKALQQAETQKAIANAAAFKNTDRITPLLSQWGVHRVTCAPTGVFINGLTPDTVCVNPTNLIPAGYYNYISERQLLVRIESNHLSKPTLNTSKNLKEQGF